MTDRTRGEDLWWEHSTDVDGEGNVIRKYDVVEIPLSIPTAIQILEIVARRLFEFEQHQGNFSLTPVESDLLRVIDWMKDPLNMESIYTEIQSPLDPDGNPWSIYPGPARPATQYGLDLRKVDLSKVLEEVTGIDMTGLEEVSLKVTPDRDDEVDFW